MIGMKGGAVVRMVAHLVVVRLRSMDLFYYRLGRYSREGEGGRESTRSSMSLMGSRVVVGMTMPGSDGHGKRRAHCEGLFGCRGLSRVDMQPFLKIEGW